MIEDTIRLYQGGRFTSIPLPAWFLEAVSISSTEKLDWHRVVSRVLDAEHQGLTMEPTGPAGLEISFWPSAQQGIYVEIDTELGLVEQVLIPRPADWLPFMSAHLTPLLAAVGHVAVAAQLERIANALIAFGRHEHGEHIDRSTGRSRIDETRDAAYRARLRARAGK